MGSKVARLTLPFANTCCSHSRASIKNVPYFFKNLVVKSCIEFRISGVEEKNSGWNLRRINLQKSCVVTSYIDENHTDIVFGDRLFALFFTIW